MISTTIIYLYIKRNSKMKSPNEFGNLCLLIPHDNGGRSRTYLILCTAISFSLFNFLSYTSAVHHHQHSKEGTCEEYYPNMASLLGGLRDSHGASQNSADSDDLGRFAVDEHNKKQNSLLEFARVVKAQEQVVAGTLHHLTIEAIEAGKKKLYEAKVWVKPWMDFKELQEFKHVGDVPNITNSDLGAWTGDHPSGWQDVSVHDPEVQSAADHALKKIQERSNSLLPLELQEVSEAKAEVGNESAKFNMVLKVKRGSKEDKFNVEVHKKNDGDFHLNHFKASE